MVVMTAMTPYRQVVVVKTKLGVMVVPITVMAQECGGGGGNGSACTVIIVTLHTQDLFVVIVAV